MTQSKTPKMDELESLKDQLQWSIKNEQQYKDALGEALAEINELKQKLQDLGELNRDLLKSNQDYARCIQIMNNKLDVAVKALEFYAKHHHHMNTTSPNFALEALDKIKEVRGEM